jgi:hypothetical protein
LLFLADFKGFFNPQSPLDCVVFRQVYPLRHSFLTGTIYT